MAPDLRDWLALVEQKDKLATILGADWNEEIGAITALNWKKPDPPVLLFDEIKGYPPGYRVVTGTTLTANKITLIFGLPRPDSKLDLLGVFRQKLKEWEVELRRYEPQIVKSGPVLENVRSGTDVDLLEFPAPKWHELDGGRYIGTGDAVVTRDPDSGELNVGTYRVMIHEKDLSSLHIVPGRHGRVHYEKYHALGRDCPVAVSLGHHPLVFRIASIEVPNGTEYQYIGAVQKEPLSLIREEITGLPVPADSEVVIAGFCPPGETREDGPFGEFLGYYSGQKRQDPVIHIQRIYYRGNPILLGSPPGKAPFEDSYYLSLVRSAMLQNELLAFGIPDIVAVWIPEVGGTLFIIISVKQRYAGHAMRAALVASQSAIASSVNKYVVVVDEDVDPTNLEDVLWAIGTRTDPAKSIDIVRRCWDIPTDPMVRKPATAFSNSRAFIDACKPFEWINEFPRVAGIRPELAERIRTKFGSVIS